MELIKIPGKKRPVRAFYLTWKGYKREKREAGIQKKVTDFNKNAI